MMSFRIRRVLTIVFVVSICLAQGYAATAPSPGKNGSAAAVEIKPTDFGGADLCLRDTAGPENECSRRYGQVRSPGGEPERPCLLAPAALEALKNARVILKKENPDLEIIVISSYRPPEHQQCLWVERTSAGYKCNPYVCGARDPATGAHLPCRHYDLDDPRFEHIFDRCPHVNQYTVDACAYNRSLVKLNDRNQLDLTQLADCRKRATSSGESKPFHPCCCRFADWTSDIRNASPRARALFGDQAVGAQRSMIRAFKKAGWADNAPGEWWHFKYVGK